MGLSHWTYLFIFVIALDKGFWSINVYSYL